MKTVHHAPITDRKIRFALVGCGRIANNHFGSLEKHATVPSWWMSAM